MASGASIPCERVTMIRRHPVGCLLLVLTLPVMQTCATAQTYSAKPITATVVDSESGAPLEGVNVVAHWVLHDRTSWASIGELELLETVTDKDGKFHFPGWEGKAPPRDGPYESRLNNGDPILIFFKSGYMPSHRGNYLQPERLRDADHTWERYSDWDGKVIKLEKIKGNLREYAHFAGFTVSDIHYQNCVWTKMPHMLMSLFKEGDRLRALGVRENLPSYAKFKDRT